MGNFFDRVWKWLSSSSENSSGNGSSGGGADDNSIVDSSSHDSGGGAPDSDFDFGTMEASNDFIITKHDPYAKLNSTVTVGVKKEVSHTYDNLQGATGISCYDHEYAEVGGEVDSDNEDNKSISSEGSSTQYGFGNSDTEEDPGLLLREQNKYSGAASSSFVPNTQGSHSVVTETSPGSESHFK